MDSPNLHNNNAANNNNNPWSPSLAHFDLSHSIPLLASRGLKLATKWAAEQLMGIDLNQVTNDPIDLDQQTSSPPPLPPPPSPLSPLSPAVAFAKSLLDLGEYDRAAAVLSIDGRAKPGLPDDGVFVRAYSQFLAGEKRKEEDIVELTTSSPLERTKVQNSHLPQLRSELAESHAEGTLDSFGLYIYGVVLKELLQQQSPEEGGAGGGEETNEEEEENKLLEKARDVLVESILEYEFNW